MVHVHVIQALSLMAAFGLDGSNFKSGLEKCVKDAAKTGPSLEKSFFAKLKQSSILNWLTSPIGAATAVLTGFMASIGAAMDAQMNKAAEIKKFMGTSQLDSQSAQRVMNAAQGAGVDQDAAAKAILKIAEAQDKIKRNAPGAADALRAFSEVGVTLRDVQQKSYQDLFFQIGDSMKVANLDAGQLAAGAELMGKSFENLGPMFQRGFNNVADGMKTMSDEEMRMAARDKATLDGMKAAWTEVLAIRARQALNLIGAKIGGDDDAQNAAMMRNQEKINARLAAKAKQENAAAQKKLDAEKAAAELAQKTAKLRIDAEKTVHDLRAKSHQMDLNSNQRIGAFAGNGRDAHLTVAQQQLHVQQQTLSMQSKILSAMQRAAQTRTDRANEAAFLNGDFS